MIPLRPGYELQEVWKITEDKFKYYLVESKESERFNDRPSRDCSRRSNFSGNLQTDLDDLERVREHDLRSASLK